MSDAFTVVIGAAGLGTRLGLSKPKALVEIAGKPILQHQLEMLQDVPDVVVVAGYQAPNVIELVRDIRPGTTIALNHEYASTGTAASVAHGSVVSSDYVVSLDGDLLVDPDDFHTFCHTPGSCLGIFSVRSNKPVYAKLDEAGELVVDLSQDVETEWEWAGLVKMKRETATQLGRIHVFQGLLPALPIEHLIVDATEVDDPEDLKQAERWLAAKNAR